MQLSTDAIVVGQLMQAFPYESSDIAGRAYVQQVDEAPGDVKDAREGYVRNLVRVYYSDTFSCGNPDAVLICLRVEGERLGVCVGPLQ